MGAHGNAEGVSRGFEGIPEVRQTLAEATINFVKPTGLDPADCFPCLGPGSDAKELRKPSVAL